MTDNKGSPVKDEHGLASKHKAEDQLDHQRIKRIFKYLVAAIGLVGLLGLAIFLFYQFCQNSPFREEITKILLSNIATVVVSGIAFLGFAQKN